MFKRMLSAFMAAVLLLVPCAALAGSYVRETDEPELTPINEVRIYGYEAPAAGENSADHLAFAVPPYASYSVITEGDYAPGWWDEDAEGFFDGVFVEGVSYSVRIVLEADEGYCFSEDCVVFINDDEYIADMLYSGADEDDNTFLYVWTSPEDAVGSELDVFIPRVRINGLALPVIGGAFNASALSVPDGAHYSIDVENTYWCWHDDELWESSGTVFNGEAFTEPEMNYFLTILIIPDEGYYFSWDTAALINGSAEYVAYPSYEYDGTLTVYSVDFYIEEPDFMPGDVNADGVVNTEDALLTLRCSMGAMELDPVQRAAADYNFDGVVNMTDALLILRRAMGAI